MTKTADLYGPLELVSGPSSYPVTLDEARAHLNCNTVADDEMIEDDIIPAATEFIEAEIPGGRSLMATTWDLPLAGFWSGPLQLPQPPLSSVTSLKYYDTNGTLTTVDASAYLVRTPRNLPGTIERAPDSTWNYLTQSDRRLPVVIRFVAGYASAAAVPRAVKQAVKIACEWLYQNRGPLKAELDCITRLLAGAGYGFYG